MSTQTEEAVRELTIGQAVKEALAEEMRQDPTVFLIGEDVAEAVARARRGEGPSVLICHTYRYRGHHVGDVDRAYYRSRAEEEEWQRERDPIARLAERLVEAGARPDQLEAAAEQADTEVREGVQFGLEAPFPDPAEVTEDVYAD